MTKPMEIPDCSYPTEAVLVAPCIATPRHPIYLSNLDDQPFLRFAIRYMYIYKMSVPVANLRSSLSRVLVDYYPLAGRLRISNDDLDKLEVECNGQGALFAEGFLDRTAAELLEGSRRPNRSWRKLLYRVDQSRGFLGVPPLVVHVIHLSCGGMILCAAISHCLCDGIGTAQFLDAWAQLTANPNVDLPVAPFHSRHVLKPQTPPRTAFSHPEFTVPSSHEPNLLQRFYQSQPLVAVSATFAPAQILHLKKQCIPSFKCTSFEVLASHVWRAWARAMDLPATLNVKLLFSVNVRKKLNPELPKGYYGNGFVLGCAESSVDSLITSNAHYSVKLVRLAKERVTDGYVRSMIDLLAEKKQKMPDLSASLVISQWAKMGLEELDFGEGRPMHMGPVASEIYCLLVPVVGDLHAFTVIMSVPQGAAEKFEHLLNGSN